MENTNLQGNSVALVKTKTASLVSESTPYYWVQGEFDWVKERVESFMEDGGPNYLTVHMDDGSMGVIARDYVAEIWIISADKFKTLLNEPENFEEDNVFQLFTDESDRLN